MDRTIEHRKKWIPAVIKLNKGDQNYFIDQKGKHVRVYVFHAEY